MYGQSQPDEGSARYRREIEDLRRESERWFRATARLRASRSWRASTPLRVGFELAREVARCLKSWNADPSGSTPLLSFLTPSTLTRARLFRRSGLFDPEFYLRRYPDVVELGLHPLVHYVVAGAREKRVPNPLFDVEWYGAAVDRDGRGDLDPIEHYLTVGAAQGLDPHPLFDTSYYRDQNADVAAAGINPLAHYLAFGAFEARNPHPLFHAAFYLDRYPDVAASGTNPLLHYLQSGADEGRSPSPDFDSSYYVSSYPDVRESGLNPLIHYVLHGQKQRRRTRPPLVPSAMGGSALRSTDAYSALVRQAREEDASRLGGLILPRPDLIALPERGELEPHARSVSLAAVDAPEVSIVVLVVNNVRMTLECLLSISRFTADASFEVIAVHNGSMGGATGQVLGTIPNLTCISIGDAGYGRRCHAGADVARGRHLVFLSGQAQVTAGWLTPLLRTLIDGNKVGAVGPKILFPDGRLQEAGSLVNPDGTPTPIGLFDDPSLPRFNERREVESVSGVCLMTDARHFRDLGGFRSETAAGASEHVRLCLRLREGGFRTFYEPSANVVHHLADTWDAPGPTISLATVSVDREELPAGQQAQIDQLAATRLVAFYLPQFHPIPENDLWWGKGFTEWRNVTRARPNFAGHDQPRLPADLGFYDLRLPEIYAEQVGLAARYGIHGFCFYYYWFGGKRLLEMPIERLLRDAGTFPFCLCWANESWTRKWDGKEHDVLIAQSYRDDHDLAVIDDLIRYMRHPSYIRVSGRPLLLIYRIDGFPEMSKTARLWRDECRRQGVGEIYLAAVESHAFSHATLAQNNCGFDATVEFPPHQVFFHEVVPARIVNEAFTGHVFDYPSTALHAMTQAPAGRARFRTVMPGWDNTARRQDDAVIFKDSTPGAYQAWLESVLYQTRQQAFGDERLVFINAWNEWAECAYLEPDLTWGHAYLEATSHALHDARVRFGRE